MRRPGRERCCRRPRHEIRRGEVRALPADQVNVARGTLGVQPRVHVLQRVAVLVGLSATGVHQYHEPTQKNDLLAKIASWHINNDKGNNPATAEAFYEAWLWFRGERVHLGNKTVSKNDSNAFIDGDARTTYKSPGVGCAKNHIIYLANGAPNDNNTKAEELLKRINPSATRIRIPAAKGVGNNDEANWADEFAAFFSKGADLSSDFEGQQTIQVHAIAVTGAKSDGNFPAFIKWIANDMGGGLYQEARDADTIIAAVKDALNQIRASNSAFSSAALPASANTQGAYLNQVFIGMFRPDGNALQRWVGNLKQYQFKYDEVQNTLELADKDNNPAVSTVTGFINNDAISFWTQPSTFWINADTASSGKYSKSDSPDGPLVEKGGIGQGLRTTYTSQTGLQVTRPVYTCLEGSCASTGRVNLVDDGDSYKFSKANSLLKNTLKPLLPAGRDDPELLINWIRGEENVIDSLSNVGDFNVAKDQLTSPPTGTICTPLGPRRCAARAPRGVELRSKGRRTEGRRLLRRQRRHAARDQRQQDGHRGRQRAVGLRGAGALRHAQPAARERSGGQVSLDTRRRQPDKAQLLLRRPDRRVPEHHEREGDDLRHDAPRRPFGVRVRRQRSRQADARVAHQSDHHRLHEPGPDVVDAPGRARQEPSHGTGADHGRRV